MTLDPIPPNDVYPTLPDAEACPRRETVLVVDDEDMVGEFVRRILELDGYTVLRAKDGDDALSIARSHSEPIHLLLTDVNMPGMNGLELAEQVERMRPGIKVLFASGCAEDAIVDCGVLDPRENFLPKPFTLDSLSLKVRQVLDGN